MTGGVQAGLSSSEINRLRVADPVASVGRPHVAPRNREWCNGPAESKNPSMYPSFLHGNREIPEAINRAHGGSGRKRPQAVIRHARDREVGHRHSIDETDEQK